MDRPEFKEWPKIARFNREIIITEKIDGTNGVIYIGENGEFEVGSRTRWLTPNNDNYGFAQWAYNHQQDLLKLGKGYHYGEWWGNGIQRGYGLPSGLKVFSLFNVVRWSDATVRPECCVVVPVLYCGPFSQLAINNCLDELKMNGSKAVPFLNPEGIVIYHKAANISFKITLENDAQPKAKVSPEQHQNRDSCEGQDQVNPVE